MSSDDEIRKFVETYKITFPVGKEKGLAGMLGVRGIPMTVYIDKKGRIVKRQFGVATYADLSATIEAMLK